MNILANRMDRGYLKYQEEFEESALRVLRSGWYVLGNEVLKFEEEFANYIGSKYCVGLGSGLDALWITFRLLGIGSGDEVIVQGNAYIACVMGITMNGATPVFIEPDRFYSIDISEIEKNITDKTKAILVVHLYGMPANMDKILEICKKYNIILVEDCAQSHGAKYKGKNTGTFGDVGCFSFYPSKNLGGFGEGGAIVTDNKELADSFKVFRNYGSEKRYFNKIIGTNSRLDELQAALLRVRLKHLDEINKERCYIAEKYNNEINNPKIIKPYLNTETEPVWHQYVVQCQERERLMTYLNDKKINTIIHYPKPPHLQEAYSYLNMQKGDLPITELFANSVLSLPIYNGMTESEQNFVIDTLNMFY